MNRDRIDAYHTTWDQDSPPLPVVPAEVASEAPLQPPAPRPRLRRTWLPALLFVSTCASTVFAWVLFDTSMRPLSQVLWDGLLYGGALMFILLCHEMGHFLQARRYGVYATWPFFLPMPITPIGTFGAVIAMDAYRGDRKAIFDIGISGPLAGLAPALLFCVLGLSWSTTSDRLPLPGEPIVGSSILFSQLTQWFVEPGVRQGFIDLHPLAMAGWVGLLITSLNLIPIGQLDGGHILYALLRTKAHKISTLLLLGAVAAVIYWGYPHWALMLALLAIMGPIHPPTADDHVPLGVGRTVLGILALAFIPLAFTPVPFSFLS